MNAQSAAFQAYKETDDSSKADLSEKIQALNSVVGRLDLAVPVAAAAAPAPAPAPDPATATATATATTTTTPAPTAAATAAAAAATDDPATNADPDPDAPALPQSEGFAMPGPGIFQHIIYLLIVCLALFLIYMLIFRYKELNKFIVKSFK